MDKHKARLMQLGMGTSDVSGFARMQLKRIAERETKMSGLLHEPARPCMPTRRVVPFLKTFTL